MPLRDLLTSLMRRIEGAYAVMLMGYDCIAIDEVQQDEAGFDVQVMAVEYGTLIKEIRRTIQIVGAGEMEEVTISSANAQMIIRILNDQFFAVCIMAKDGNLGKARYLLRLNQQRLIEAVE